MTPNGHDNGKQQTMTIVSPKMIVIRVFRIEPGHTASYVRMLSPNYVGIFTHYHRGRSQYCSGRDCPSPAHKIDRVWKGYTAAQAWEPAGKKWYPVCLEITESLELTFRGAYARGQVWELWRDLGPKGKSLPVVGKLLEERDQAAAPPPFDIVPCLRALYHVDHLDMTATNPLPPRVMVAACEDSGPEALTPKLSDSDGNGTETNFTEEFKKRQRERAKETKAPSDNKPAYRR